MISPAEQGLNTSRWGTVHDVYISLSEMKQIYEQFITVSWREPLPLKLCYDEKRQTKQWFFVPLLQGGKIDLSS